MAVGEGLEGDGTPFQSGRRAMAAPFTQRHVEESWLHLLLAGDFTRLKDLTICNFDFLHAAVGHIWNINCCLYLLVSHQGISEIIYHCGYKTTKYKPKTLYVTRVLNQFQ